MKYFLTFILFLFLLHQNITAQLTQVFPTENAYWELDYMCYDGPGVGWSFTATVLVEKDSTLGNGYSRISGLYDTILVNVIGDKVYFKYLSQPIDTAYLVLDYGLAVGDTFFYPELPFSDYDDFMIIESIDTVTFLDGIARKRLKFDAPYLTECLTTEYWVEGIGGMPNPFYHQHNCFACRIPSFRFYQNGELVLDYRSISTKKIDEHSNIIITPNPVREYINIKSLDRQIEELKIFDFTGKLIASKVVKQNDLEFQVPSNLGSGMYLINLTLDNHKIVQKRVIIH